MRVIGRATNQTFRYVKGQSAVAPEPVNDLADLCHDLGADAVAGKDKKRRVAHGRFPLKT